jgi:hypothetical protein
MAHTADDVTPLRAEVMWFAEAMEVQLCANDHKPGWHDMPLLRLLVRLEQEARELRRAIERDQARPNAAHWIITEAADVANFAMMIADNVARADAVRNT